MRYLLLLLILWASPLQAGEWAERGHDVSGRVGVRLALADTPIGIRYFWEPRYGADVSIGFALGSDPPTTVNIDGGFLYALAPGERMNLHLRPGLKFRSVDQDSLTVTTIEFSLSTEVEFFATQELSVSGGMGVSLASASGRGKTDTRVSTFSDFFGRAAIQYYFPR